MLLTQLFLVDTKKEDKKEDSSKEEGGEMPFICPLCREGFRDKETLENHAMAVHGINAEGLQRLMMLMQGSHWLNNANKEDEERDSGECVQTVNSLWKGFQSFSEISF